MNKLLQALGLMRVSEDEAVKPEDRSLGHALADAIVKPRAEATDWEAKFKKAITDLAAARDEVAIYDSAFPADVMSIIDVMTDYNAYPAEQVAADASEESGLTITPARVSAVRKALHTLDLAGFGSLFDEDSTHVVGRGYWLTKTGAKLQTMRRKRERDRDRRKAVS